MFSRQKKNPRRLEATRAQSVAARVRRAAMFALRVVFVLVLTVAGAAGSVQLWRWVRQTDKFAIRHVALRGAQRATEDELLRRARVGFGQNLFAVDFERAERAMAQHPWVKSVRLMRRLPDTLEVQVQERSAAAVLALGDLYLVDSEGEPFKRLAAEDAIDLPIVTGLDREAFDGRHAPGPARLKLALDALAAWAKSPAAEKESLSEARLSDEGVVLVTSSGLEVRLGDEQFDARLERLVRVRAELAGRALEARVVRLDNRARPSWITVQLSSAGLERGKPPKK